GAHPELERTRGRASDRDGASAAIRSDLAPRKRVEHGRVVCRGLAGRRRSVKEQRTERRRRQACDFHWCPRLGQFVAKIVEEGPRRGRLKADYGRQSADIKADKADTYRRTRRRFTGGQGGDLQADRARTTDGQIADLTGQGANR